MFLFYEDGPIAGHREWMQDGVEPPDERTIQWSVETHASRPGPDGRRVTAPWFILRYDRCCDGRPYWDAHQGQNISEHVYRFSALWTTE